MNKHVRLMYPKMNTNEIAMFYDKNTQEFIICRNLNPESGQYDYEHRSKNPLEIWTSYIDGLDSIVRRQIMNKYTKEQLGLVTADDPELTEEEREEIKLLNHDNERNIKDIDQIDVAEIFRKVKEAEIHATDV